MGLFWVMKFVWTIIIVRITTQSAQMYTDLLLNYLCKALLWTALTSFDPVRKIV